MIRIELSSIIEKLNPVAKLALEEAASLCISRCNQEVNLQHLMLCLLDNPLSDLRVILKQLDFEIETLKPLLSAGLQKSEVLDTYPAFSPLLVELLQEAWLLSSTELAQQQLRSGAIFIAALSQPARYLTLELSRHFDSINKEHIRKNFAVMTRQSSETEIMSSTSNLSPGPISASSALAKFSSNLSQQARDEKLDPVLCRDNEINLMIDILCRRRKNNPIVVGDAGVGKSAVVEGLALRIHRGQVPDSLKEVELLSLDLGQLQAGASVKGEFERRLKAVIEEVKNSVKPIILFIDEAHTLIGAGNLEGGGDAANLLKPALARGELCTIAATTWKEYKKYFEKDPALSRRFQLVKLDEPTVDQSKTILRGLHSVYEQAHGVLIDDQALCAAAYLSSRYLAGRQLPDKAIDVLDTACARIAINLSSPPRQLTERETEESELKLEVELLERQQLLGQQVDTLALQNLHDLMQKSQTERLELEQLWLEQKKIVTQIIALRQQLLTGDGANAPVDTSQLQRQLQEKEKGLGELCNKYALVVPQVNEAQIASVISDWTGVPVDQMHGDELYKISHLPDLLATSLKGQELAIATIHKNMLTSRADLRREGRPKGAFLLVGPSGVGKTETVVQIAQTLYGGKQFLSSINMSEYQEKHTVSRLIGSPPGYVGFGEGGVLTEAIRKMPYSIVLLDEVEKAHPDVLNLFYQAFDKGELADGEGRLIDCQNILFFLTSNLAYQTIVDNAATPELIENKIYPELADFFKPALLARMEVVPYLPLNRNVLQEIVSYKLESLSQRLALRYKAEVNFSDELISEILKRATRSENGARMLEAIIDGQVLPPVAQQLLNKLAQQEPVKSVSFSVVDGQFVGVVA